MSPNDQRQPTPVTSQPRDVTGIPLSASYGAADSLEQDARTAGALTQDIQSSRRVTRLNPFELRKQRIMRLRLAAVASLILIGGVVIILQQGKDKNVQNASADASQRYSTQTVPLASLSNNSGGASIQNNSSLSINGQLSVNNGLVLSPISKPSSAIEGQLYYDQTSNKLTYYDGKEYITVLGTDTAVQSINGAQGNVSTGQGLTVVNNQITNSGVLSVAGQTGALDLGDGLAAADGKITSTGVLTLQGQSGNVSLTAGNGVAISGTTISSTGVTALGGQNGAIAVGSGLSVAGGTLKNDGIISATAGSGIAVVNDGNGNITISNVGGSGSGTVASPGGTANKLAKFTGVQAIADSLISDDGTNVTVAGNLSVTGTLSLSSALTVAQGGTGVGTLATNGVLVGHGTSGLTSVVAGANGLCLVSTVSGPTWQACPGSGGSVTSLDGLSGAITIANTSGTGSIVTIDDATSAAKGIASFNATNFLVTAGAVNTIQDIAVTATPTFNGLVLSNALGTSSGGTGSNTTAGARTNLGAAKNGANSDITSLSGLSTALSVLQGGTGSTTLTANGVLLGNGTSAVTSMTGSNGQCLIVAAGAPTFGTCPGSGGVTSLDGLTGIISLNNTSGTSGTITIDDAGTAQKGIASFSSSNFSVTAGAVNTIQNIGTGASPTFTGLSLSGALSVNNITPTAAAQFGVTTQNLTLQGANTTITSTNGANTAQLKFVAPTANVIYQLQTATGGTYDICTTAGNCVGTGGGVTSVGGTNGKLAKFTGAQSIADSLISDNGTTVTVAGNLSITGTGTLTLANALTVANGGTGATSFSANSVVIGNGSGTLSSATTATPGQCLVSTAGAPAFGTCPGSGGVTSVNGQTGVINVANASGAGNTITINDASAAAKGIASFNSTNLTVTAGAVNTVQDINTTAAPTFGQLSLTSSQASNPMLLLNNTNVSATGNLLDLQLNGSSKFSVAPGGNVTSAGTINGQTISSSANFTGSLAVGSTLSVNTITPTSSLTVGATGQSFLLQGNASSKITATNGANSTSLAFQSPTANVTYNFLAAAAGSYDVCTTAGNCAGVGGSVTTAGGTAGKIAKFTGTNGIGDSIISDNGTVVTIGGDLSVNSITPTAALTVGATGQNLTLQGASVSLSSTSGGITNSLNFTTPAGSNKTVTIPNASGTIAVSASGPLSIDALGNLTCATCLTSGGGGGSAGVSSLNTLTGAVILQGVSAGSVSVAGNTITVNDATSAVKGLASFNSTNLTVTSGSVNTIQDISVTSTPTFGGLTLSSALTVANGGTGSSTAAGARTNLGVAASGANTDITSLSGLTTALSVAQGGTGVTTTPTNGQILIGNGTGFSLNTLTAGAGVTITNNSGAITIAAGGAGTCASCANTALSNLASVAINTSLLPASSAGADLGSGTLAFGQLFLAGTSSSPATNNFRITGASTSGTRTITLPDASGTVAVSASGYLNLNSTTGNLTFSGTLAVSDGGTGATSASGARSNLGAAASGANSDITSLTGLTTALSLGQGGTGATTAAGARGNINAAALGANSDITSLSGLTTALSVVQGGTGNSSFTANSVLLGSGTSALTTVTGSNGQCLVVVAGAPVFTTCPGSGGVTSLNGQTGVLTVSNSSASAGTITLDTATTSTLGIASFNSTNFSVTAGAVNTIQNINTGATPTFAGLSTSTVTSAGTLTVGTTSQPLILQGNASTTLTATGGGFTTSVGFAGTPTGAVAYNFDRSAAAGTYTVCTTAGNCTGSGGGVTTAGGTTGKIAKFSGSQTLADSILSESGSTVTAAGNINVTTGNQYQINGTQISSANLSNDGNLAKINGAQTFTGASNTFKNTTDSTSAFSIQNAAGRSLLNVDTTNAKFTFGNITSTAGQGVAGTIILADGTNDNFGLTINTQTLTASRTISLPNEAGTICLQNSANCGFLTGASATGSYIQLQASTPGSAQTGNLNITGTGIAGHLQTNYIDNNGSTLTINNGSTNGGAVTLAIQGGVSIASVNSGDYATFTSPLGNISHAAMAFQPYAVGSGDAIISLGLNGSSNTFATAINVMDSRSGTHAPAINLSSPNEAQSFGLNWNGQNGKAYLQTSAPLLILQSGGIDGLTVETTGGNTFITLAASSLLQADSIAANNLGIASTGTGFAYTSPGGFNTSGKLVLNNAAVGGFGSQAIIGLTSGSSVSAHGLSVFDARIVSHQASLGVYSPNESDYFGLSWNGSNSTASLQTSVSTNDISLQSGTTTTAFFSHTGSLALGTSAATGTIIGTITATGGAGYAGGASAGGVGDTGAWLQGGTGGTTTGTGVAGGTGGDIEIRGGTGGNAVSGSTNGFGGSVYLRAGSPGAGAGTAGESGHVIVKNPTNGVSAFQVQTASGLSVMQVNTASGVVGFGTNGYTNGEIAFANASNGNEIYIKSPSSGVSTPYTLTLPTGTAGAGTCLTDTTGTGVLGFASCTGAGTLSGSGTANYVTRYTGANTLSTGLLYDTGTYGGYNVSSQLNSSTFAIQAAASSVGLTVRGVASTDIADFQGSGGTTLAKFDSNGALTSVGVNSGTGLIQGTGGTTVTGAINLNNTGAGATNIGGASAGGVAIQSASNLTIAAANFDLSSTGQITFKNAGAAISPNITSTSATNIWVQPGGTTASSTTGASLNLVAGDATGVGSNGGNINIDSGAGAGTLGGNIVIGSVSAKSITLGNANVNTSITIGSTSSSFDQIINIGTNSQSGPANFTTIGSTAGTSQTTIRGGTGGSALALQAGSGGTIKIGSSNVANTITVGNTGAAGSVAQTINIATNSSAGGTNTVVIGNTTATASTVTINGGTGASALNLATGTNGSINASAGGTGNINLTTNSATSGVFTKSATNSTTAFQVQNTSTNAVFNVDTTINQITLGTTTGSGSSLLNNGATVNTVYPMANLSSGGWDAGGAAATVDRYTAISANQTTASQTLTPPAPTANTTYGRLLYVSNIGTVPFNLLGLPLANGATGTLVWSNTNGGATWQYAGADGNSILNQSATPQTADFNISGTGRIGTSLNVPNVSSSNNLTLQGLSGTVTIQASSGQNVTISPGAANGGSGTLDLAVNAATLNIGNGSNNVRTIAIGSTGGSQAQTITIGNNGGSSSVTTIQGSNGVVLQANSASAGVTVKSVTNSTAAFQVQNTSSVSLFNVDTSTSTITFGNGGNTLTLSAGTFEPILAGNARHSKSIVLTPEYAGGVLDATSDATCASANNGTMTSGYDETNRMNYYNWMATVTPAQCYDVIVQVPIPSDWVQWTASNPIGIQVKSSNATNGTYAIQIRNSGGADTTFCGSGYCAPNTVTTSWSNVTSGTTLSGSNYAASGYFTIKVRTSSLSSANLQLGNITLNYLSKY